VALTDSYSCTGKIRYEEYRVTRDSDPDPAFYSNADPDPAAKNNADPCRSESGPATLVKNLESRLKRVVPES
jgi:hypothetical protein